MSVMKILLFIAMLIPFTSSAIPEIHHFMYVSRDRELIHDKTFLASPQFKGAQVMYAWKDLEKTKDHYDFSVIAEDIALLSKHNKKLFVQLQDTTFLKTNKAVPKYLLTPEYRGGAVPQCDSKGNIYGWVGLRWHSKVRQRFQNLIRELGKTFDGKIAGINLQETSIQVDECPSKPIHFTDSGYRDSTIETMTVLSQSFKKSTKMQYANFYDGRVAPLGRQRVFKIHI